MTDTIGTLPEHDMTRAPGCPFDPGPALRQRQTEAPITRVRLANGKTPWLVTRYAEQRALLADPRISSDPTKPQYPSPAERSGEASLSFILMDDPEHARLRRMVTSAFAIKKVAAMRPGVQRIVDDLIDRMLAGPKPVDLVEAFALPVPSLVICQLLGVPYTDHDFFQENSRVIIHRDSTMDQRNEAMKRLFGYLQGLIQERLTRPADDLLSDLARRVNEGELTERMATETGVLMLIAGHETTANMIALGTVALLEHPDQLARLRDDASPELVTSAVNELLRYLTITHGGRRRTALADIEIGDVVIREGDGVILANELGNRDPEVFEDPDTLDLGRDARRHVAFGFGVHQCLGQPLARMELEVVYSTLYRRIPDLRLAVPLDEVPFKHDGLVYGVYRLPVTWLSMADEI